MFCPNCGAKLNDAAKYCGDCGAPTAGADLVPKESKTAVQPPLNIPLETYSKSKKSALKWMLPAMVLIVALVVVAAVIIRSSSEKNAARVAASNYYAEKYGSAFDDPTSIEETDDGEFIVTYDLDKEYEFWSMTGTIKLSVNKIGDEWVADVEEEDLDYSFAENDNWYHISASGNREYLIKMDSFTQDEVVLEYYSYSMGSYNSSDDFDHERSTCDLKYDADNKCFAFTFLGDWRINGNYIEYNKFEVGVYYEYYQSSGEFTIKHPVNCEDYWWYERAKNRYLK